MQHTIAATQACPFALIYKESKQSYEPWLLTKIDYKLLKMGCPPQEREVSVYFYCASNQSICVITVPYSLNNFKINSNFISAKT